MSDAPREMGPDGSPQLYTKDADRGFLLYFATEGEILTQPCVVEALRKAREDALEEAARACDNLKQPHVMGVTAVNYDEAFGQAARTVRRLAATTAAK